MTIILGLDPGSRITGYGVLRVTSRRQEYVTSGCIKANIKESLPARLDDIFQGVSQIVDEYIPTELAIEQIFMARNVESALKLGQARGVAILAAVIQGIPVYEYEARKIKQALVGSGASTKAQIQHMVKSLLRLPDAPQADAADALAVAICHVNTRQGLARLETAGHIAPHANQFRRGRLAHRTGRGSRP